MRGVGVVDRRRAYAIDLAGGHGHPGAGPADEDSSPCLSGGDSASDLERLVGVIDRLRRVGTEIEDLMALGLDQRHQPRTQQKPGVIESARDDHVIAPVADEASAPAAGPDTACAPEAESASSCTASSAAPSTPARTPWRATRIVVRRPS